jgi:hypothetical protein
MFIQVITGKVLDADGFRRQDQTWHDEVEPGAVGFLGSTAGITGDGRFFVSARFESAEAASANSARPEQNSWWSEMEKSVSDVVFHDCDEVVLLAGGGSNDAGFVQVMVGRVKDRAKFDAFNAKSAEVEKAFSEWRPDVLGETLAIHNDGDGYTDIIYFTSEAEARAGEKKEPTPEVQALMGEMDAAAEVVDYLDLAEPALH